MVYGSDTSRCHCACQDQSARIYTYDCPLGYHWATTAEAAARFQTTSSTEEREIRIQSREGYVYWDRCGWDAFTWASKVRRRYRLADSATTGAFKDAGGSESRQLVYSDMTTAELAC